MTLFTTDPRALRMRRFQTFRGILHKLATSSRTRIPLCGWRRKLLFVMVAGAPVILAGSKATEIAFASVCLDIGTPPALRRALAADPSDPEVRHRLGQALLYNFTDANAKDGFQDLREATRLAPSRPLYWEDLALASESLNDDLSAQIAIVQALKLAPVSPRVHWLAANYDLDSGETTEGLAQLREVLRLGPDYAAPVYELCLLSEVDPATVENTVLPAGDGPALRLEYATFLANQGQADAAGKVWNDTVAANHPFPFSLAQPYVDSLMRAKDYGQAHRAWKDLERIGAIERPDNSGADEMMFNGGFERQPLNAGFDWHYGETSYLALNFAEGRAAEGHRCLRLTFTVPSNAEYEPVFEDVAVEPSRAYILTALARSEGITSDSGPRLRVIDLVQPEVLDTSTAQTVGTTSWHTIQVKFTTGAYTHFIQVFIWRPQAVTFPAQISGIFWLDGVSLKRRFEVSRAS